MEDETQHTDERRPLYFTSYAHKLGPLNPPPDLLIDVRSLPNPSKQIRDGSTGLSKRLRKEFFAITTVQDRYDETINKIKTFLESHEEWECRIGVCCEMGRHRSVSFVHELARCDWTDVWRPIEEHRDVDGISDKKERGKKERGSRKTRIEMDDDD
jgi:RNase adaptor protein for sRNA GlmZ degradation